MNKKCVLEMNNVNFSYNGVQNTLNNISFKIYQGDYICVVGPNGSGKSTLSKIISALLKPSSGEIYINGELMVPGNFNRLRKNIGVIFQNPDNQFIGITGCDDIAFGLENYKVKHEVMDTIINQASTIIGINSFNEKEVFELSGGQKQKVAITSIIALSPNIIIFDESTSMLDPKNKLAIKKLMKWLQIEYNKTIISITHDMEELVNATKILCINKGNLVRFDTLDTYVKDYNFLIDNKMDLPKNLKLIKLLNEKGFKLEPSLDNDKLVRDLCK